MKVTISSRAQRELARRTSPIFIELELYFSCLIRKRVLFHDRMPADAIDMELGLDKVNVQFRPVMTKACPVGESNVHDPEVEKFPVKRAERFYPKWLDIDFSNGRWKGEFGYSRKA